MKRFIIAVIFRLLFIVVAVVLFPIWLGLIPIYWVWFCVMYVVAMPIGWVLNGKDGIKFVQKYILFMRGIERREVGYYTQNPHVFIDYEANEAVYRWYWDLMGDIIDDIELFTPNE